MLQVAPPPGNDGCHVLKVLIGSIEERNDTYAVLSPESPLGQALLGAGPGAKVRYQGPKRELGVTVVAVRPLT